MKKILSILVLLCLGASFFYLVRYAGPEVRDHELPPPHEKPVTIEEIAKAYKHIDPKTGYRMGHYRAPLPKGVPGGRTIDIKEAQMLHNNKIQFIDVMAHTGAGFDPLDGSWRLSKKRLTIPGAIWLPDSGGGFLDKQMTHYFKSNLEKITKGKKEAPLVIFCDADCWIGWNAAKRAIEWGYTHINWFPEGANDWKENGGKLVEAHPVPVDLLN